MAVDPATLAGAGPLGSTLADVAGAAEAAGASSLWVVEPSGGDGGIDPYPVLGALATATRTAHLAVLPAGPDRRAPSMAAKIITGVDVLSHGRALLAVGADPAGGPEGTARLEEALAVAGAVLVGEDPTVEGRFWSIRDAVNRPRPVQAGGVPVVVVVRGVGAERAAVLAVASGAADGVLVDGGADAVAAARAAAERAGRPHVAVLALVAMGQPWPPEADGIVVWWDGTDRTALAGLLAPA